MLPASPVELSEDWDSGKSRKILSLAAWYLASRSSLVSIILSLAEVVPDEEPARSPSFPSPASDAVLEGTEELAAVLPSVDGRSPSVRRIIFIAGMAGGGVLLLAARAERGVGLNQS